MGGHTSGADPGALPRTPGTHSGPGIVQNDAIFERNIGDSRMGQLPRMLTAAEDRAEVPAPVDHAHDFHGVRSNAVDDHDRIDGNGPIARTQIVALATSLRED